MSRPIRSQRTRARWLRRRRARCQSQPTRKRKSESAGAREHSSARRSNRSVRDDAAQPLFYARDRSCRRRLSPSLTSPSLACNGFRIVCRITVNRPLLRFFPQMCVKPKEIEGLRASSRGAAPGGTYGIRSSSGHPKPLGILPMLEAHHDVVGPAHHNDSTIGLSMPAVVGAEIEGVVQVDARQERRCTRPGTSRFPCMMFPDVLRVFDRAGLPCISPLRRHSFTV